MDIEHAYESLVLLGLGVGGILVVSIVLYIKWNIFDRWL